MTDESLSNDNPGTPTPAGTESPEVVAEKVEDATLKQDRFCKLYSQNPELFGNGTLSYAEAYGYDLNTLSRVNEKDEEGKEKLGTSEYDRAYMVCAVGASRMLKNDKIQDLIIKYLNELMKNEVVDAQLAKVIMQDHKLEAKISGIKEYNKLKQRIVERQDITSGGKPIIQIAGEIAEKNKLYDPNSSPKPDSERYTQIPGDKLWP